MISEINLVFSNLNSEKKGKFACGPKFTVADFCIAALYFEIKEEMPELLEQIDSYTDLKAYLTQLELYLKSANSKVLSKVGTPSP